MKDNGVVSCSGSQSRQHEESHPTYQMPSSCFPVEKRRDLAIWDKTECPPQPVQTQNSLKQEKTVRVLLEDFLENQLSSVAALCCDKGVEEVQKQLFFIRKQITPEHMFMSVLTSHLGLHQLTLASLCHLQQIYSKTMKDGT